MPSEAIMPAPEEGQPLIKTVDKCNICGQPISTDPSRPLCSHQIKSMPSK